jgi:hypothetical protein
MRWGKTHAAVRRDDRADDERVSADDWFPMGDGWKDLYGSETLGQRRRWFRNLVDGGQL